MTEMLALLKHAHDSLQLGNASYIEWLLIETCRPTYGLLFVFHGLRSRPYALTIDE